DRIGPREARREGAAAHGDGRGTRSDRRRSIAGPGRRPSGRAHGRRLIGWDSARVDVRRDDKGGLPCTPWEWGGEGPMRKLTLAAALLAGWAQAARAQAAVPASEHARRLLDEALVASGAAPRAIDAGPDLVARFKLAGQAAPGSGSGLVRDPQDAGALCVLARAHLAQGNVGVAKLLAARAAKADPEDAEPLLVQAEIARGAGDPAAELAAARAAVETDGDSARAALALGRTLFERGLAVGALEQLSRAAELSPHAPAIRVALGTVLAAN